MNSERKRLLSMVMTLAVAITMLFNPLFVSRADAASGDYGSATPVEGLVNSDGGELEAYYENGFTFTPVNSDGGETVRVIGYNGGSSKINVPGKLGNHVVSGFSINPYYVVVPEENYDDITEINMPSSVIYLRPRKLTNFNNLEAINIAENSKYISADGLLYTKKDDGSVRLSTIPYNLSAAAITVPEGVKGVKLYKFADKANLTKVTLPSTIRMIDDNYPDDEDEDDSSFLFSGSKKTLVFTGANPPGNHNGFLILKGRTQDVNLSYPQNDKYEKFFADIEAEGLESIPDNPETITTGQKKTVDVSDNGPVKTFKFVPKVTGTYSFIATGDADTCGAVCDAEGKMIGEDDDTVGLNFNVTFEATAGETYYLQATTYSLTEVNENDDPIEETFEVKLIDTSVAEHFPAVTATCETDGNIEYWLKDNKYYKDAACTEEVSADDVVIDNLGHDYDYENGVVIIQPTLDEEGEIEYTCKNDPSHKEIESLPRLTVEEAAGQTDAQAETAKQEVNNAESQVNESIKAVAALKGKTATSSQAKSALSAARSAQKAAAAAKEKADETVSAIQKVYDAAVAAGDQTSAGIAKEALDKAKEAQEKAEKALNSANAAVQDAEGIVKAAENNAADAAKKAAADKAEADRKAAEYAANGYGYIDPTLPKVNIQKPKAAKKSFTAKWKKIKNKKQLKLIKGIEIEYSLTSDFQDPKFKTASKKKTNVKIKKLKSKKTYYVRAHTYVIRNGVKYVSNWSAPKKVKVK